MKKEDFKKYKLPESSGVYFFLDKKWNYKSMPPKDTILYVGKATVLKDRVSSYFSNDLINTRGVKLLSMVENAKDIFYIETKSVLEAILLESKYIKELKPFFNTKEKDDKSYSYVVITKEEFPRVLIMRGREIEKDKTLNIQKKIGPFISKGELVEIMKFIRKIFPYRDKCKIQEKKPCFNYQLGLCPGTCIGLINKKDYNKNIQNIIKILDGKISTLIKNLEKEMNTLARENNFESAASIRDKIKAFNYIKDIHLIKKDRIDENNRETELRIESYDVSHISGGSRVGVMVVIENGEFRKSEYKKFKLKEGKNDDLAGISEMLERRFAHKEWKYPNILVIDGGKTHLNYVYKFLKSVISEKELESISLFSVVKNDRHKAREVLSFSDVDKSKKENYNKLIILANEETHRFAINYHKLLRNKIKKV